MAIRLRNYGAIIASGCVAAKDAQIYIFRPKASIKKPMPDTDSTYSAIDPIAGSTPLDEGLSQLSASGRDMLPVVGPTGLYLGMLASGMAGGSGDCADEAEPLEPYRAADTPATLIRLLSEQDTDTVAVTDNAGHLLGVADRQSTLRTFSHLIGSDEPGATIAVRMPNEDFEIGRLTQAAELAGGKVISVLTDRGAERTVAYVKLSQEDPYPVVESLERHGYTVAALTGTKVADDTASRNYAALMKYMSI